MLQRNFVAQIEAYKLSGIGRCISEVIQNKKHLKILIVNTEEQYANSSLFDKIKRAAVKTTRFRVRRW